MYLTDADILNAADLLVNKYKVSSQLLGSLLGTDHRDDANSMLQVLGRSRLTRDEVAQVVIKRHGVRLFSGSSEPVRQLRRHLLNRISATSPEVIIRLFKRHEPKRCKISTVSYMIKPLAEKKWHDGGPWARDFVDALGFPKAFAGIADRFNYPDIEDVAPLKIPPKLVDFQVELKDRMLEVLSREGAKTRCVVTLPTGAGKTRVAVESFIDWLHPRFNDGKYLVWIAQSEELCEQAISCIRQMWASREFVSALRIYRYFGGRKIPLEQLQGGAVVASIQQLYSRAKSDDESLEEILRNTGAMIIDEAHHAVTDMYNCLIEKARQLCGDDLFPICGLTATPGRTSKEQITKLVGQFEAYLIKPDLNEEYQQNPLGYFRQKRYLAHARHIIYQSGKEYTLTDKELELMPEEEGDLPKLFLKRLSGDKDRNVFIVRKLLALPKGTPTLVYACTVDHAYFLASIFNLMGRPAGVVSSETPSQIRRQLIRDFNAGKLDFLCNFGVLTTGFDAPKTACIAICRPTTSVVLYEQIVGRGLRGPLFGGTEHCDVIDFADNIKKLGPPLAYSRFEEFWS